MERAFEHGRGGSVGRRPARPQRSPGILSRSGTADELDAATRSSSTCPSGQFPTPSEASLSDKLGADEAAAARILLDRACAAPRVFLLPLPLRQVRARLAALVARRG